MKVCYFGTFEKDYPRNVTFIEGLRKAGVEVTICHASLTADKASLGKVPSLIKLFLQYLKAYLYLIGRAFTFSCDAVIIGYPSHLDMLIFYPLFKIRNVPVFFNPLVSLYDTFVYDRAMFRAGSVVAKLIFLLDKAAFSMSDCVFIDTATHRDYLAALLGINIDKFCIVPVGALKQFFSDEKVEKAELFQVLYCGKYIPLHSVETIVRAAKLLMKYDDIKFKMIGKGQEYDKIRKIVGDEKIDNIEFIDWMEPGELSREIRRSHVVLGIFKKGGKASRVVPNKVYDAMAAGAVVVTEDSAAAREFFEEGRHLFLVTPEDPVMLAEKIVWIKEHYETATEVAKRGRERVKEVAGLEIIGKIVAKRIEEQI